MVRTRACLCAVALIVLGAAPPSAQSPPTILSVHPDLGAATLTIVGQDFTNANGVVQIGVPWTTQFEDVFVYVWTDSAIVTDLPAGNRVPGTYRLRVIRADAAAAAIDITIGATGAQGIVGPPGQQGPSGPQGLPGNLALGGQRCPAGRVLVGFLHTGAIVCEVPGQGAKTVFLSTFRMHATFNGQPTLAGADARCQQSATAANLPGTYKAWMSNSAISAADRLTRATVPYALPNGTVVADNWADLVDGTLAQPISMTEYGDVIPPSSSQVWTGTNGDGSAAALSCHDWTRETEQICGYYPKYFCYSNALFGHVGDASRSDAAWSNAAEQACNTDARLYCVQQ
jgi:hypothetical protein